MFFNSTGNTNLHLLTSGRKCQLKIELENWDNRAGWAQYDNFQVERETANFRLRIGRYNGTAGM